MGGKETSRGILYQSMVAVLEAFDSDDWNQISVEFITSEDKVDIALISQKENHLKQAIQVKSSVDSFEKTPVIRWLNDMREDLVINQKTTDEYQICLIGSCTKGVSELAKSVEKHYSKSIDKTSEAALKTLDINKFDKSRVKIINLPFDLELLKSIVRDKLHKYSSSINLGLNYTQIELISGAITNYKTQLSTNGGSISRDDFKQKLNHWFVQMKSEIDRETKVISVRSFSRATTKIHEISDYGICCMEMFDERKLREKFTWKDVCNNLLKQLYVIDNHDYSYKIHLNTHLSIVFAIGRFFDSKRGVEVYPMQRIANGGEQCWNTFKDLNDYSSWEINYIKENNKRNDIQDSVLIINITHDITEQVKDYLRSNNIKTNQIIECHLSRSSNNIVENGNHAKQLADEIPNILAKREKAERLALLHIFISAPAGFVFYLGNVSKGFGKCLLYEYDFEQIDSGSYSPSIVFPHNSNF